MKVLKINQTLNIKTFNNIKPPLTKPLITPKIDMFCKSAEVRKGLENKFIELRESFAEKLYPAYLKQSDADWNFYINSTDENLALLTKFEDEFYDLYRDKTTYDKFKTLKSFAYDKLNKHEQKHLDNILKNFEDELNAGEELKNLRAKESEIAQKYNSYVPTLDGKEVTKAEITKILETETNPEIRQKAYSAIIKGADLIADDLKEFAEMRNAYARKKGYPNYFEYKLKEEFEVDINELTALLEDIHLKSKDKISEILNKNYSELKSIFNVNELELYHYGLKPKNDPESLVNTYFKDREQIVEISKNTYNAMGYDVEKFLKEGKLTLDLFPRKGKNTHGFCFNIDAGKDARILANLTNNSHSLDTINHEMGHCVYTLGVSPELTFFDREEYPALTEAVAMMMGDIHKKENILKDIIPADLLKDFKNTLKEDDAKFIAWSNVLINFEHEMYKNPNQDLAKLFHDLKVKYQMIDKNSKPDNYWASIPHFLSHPAYYQNYFRATLMKAQIYNYLKSQLGNITENPKTAELMKEKLFKYGLSMEENELIENMTGKPLSCDDFINSLK